MKVEGGSHRKRCRPGSGAEGGTRVSTTEELEMLCHRNARRGPNLYQADDGGGIKIMFKQEESHEDRAQHTGEGAGEGARREHSEGCEPGGSHGHDTHAHTHGGEAHADMDEAHGPHHHEKGGHEADQDVSEHNPA